LNSEISTIKHFRLHEVTPKTKILTDNAFHFKIKPSAHVKTFSVISAFEFPPQGFFPNCSGVYNCQDLSNKH